MLEGIIVKLLSDLYTVKVDDEIIAIKARGKFRHLKISPKVGDNVKIENGFISQILARKNSLTRPPVTNVDQVLLVFSAVEPKFSFALLDRFISLITYNKIDIVLIVTKIDLLSADKMLKLKDKISYYQKMMDIYYTANIDNIKIIDLEKLLKNKISVLAGQSGVGKSTFVNSISSLKILTQPISKALGRGKHTTRHTELIEIYGGLIADTAGFSSLDFGEMDKYDLVESFQDFVEVADRCKYRGCLHLKEPSCEVKNLVEDKKILRTRYDNYVKFNDEIIENKKY